LVVGDAITSSITSGKLAVVNNICNWATPIGTIQIDNSILSETEEVHTGPESGKYIGGFAGSIENE
jgi:hypothetical protein